MKRASVVQILLFLLPSLSIAQKAVFQFYTTADGLTSNQIWGVAQDEQGFIWVTTNCLNRFDGRHFMNHNNEPDTIFRLLNDNPNILSLGDCLVFLEKQQVIKINTLNGEETTFPLDGLLQGKAKVNEGILINTPWGVIIPVFDKEKDEVRLIRFWQDSLSQIATLQDIYLDYEMAPASICGDKNGHLFFINKTTSKLIKTDSNGKKLQEILLPATAPWPILKPGEENDIYLMNGNQVFFLKEGATALQPHPVNQLLSAFDNDFQDFLLTPSGDLWITGGDRQLLFYSAETGQLVNFKDQLMQLIPYQQTLGKIFIDRTGVLWIRTIIGLLKVQPKRDVFETYFTQPMEVANGHCSFRGFAEDEKGRIYSSFYSNIFRIDPITKTTSGPLLSYPRTPFDLYFKDGKLFLNGGYIFDPATGQVSNPYNSIYGQVDLGIFTSDGKGTLWWAYGNSFYVLAQDAWKKILELPDRLLITDIKYDVTRQKIWLCTLYELRSFDIKSGEFQSFDETLSGENLRARFLHPDAGGLIWMATENGLVRFDPDSKKLKRYTVNDGLSNNYVACILPEGDSCLWLSTNYGLSRFSKSTEVFINFYQDDGLAANEFNRRSAFKASNGKCYFGGIKGVTAFYPQEVVQKDLNPTQSQKLSLVSFSKTDVKRDTTFTSLFLGENPTVEIYHQNKTFQFEFAMTDYRNTDKTQYSYQLEGFDKVWSKPSASNTVKFNTLPSGEYTFKVKAINGKGQWYSSELSVRVIVYPPWWATWWAYILYLLAVPGIAYIVFYFLKRRWLLENELKMKYAEAERLKELDNFKTRLYTNLTHEFRTPLTVILGMAKQILALPKNEMEMAAKLIENNGQQLLRLINQLLDLAKLENKSFKLDYQQSDIVPYLRYVTESFQTYANGRNLSLRFFTTLKKLEMDFDQEQLKQVMTNLISNAIKFTPSGGEVRVELGVKETENQGTADNTSLQFPNSSIPQLLISILDTGIGIPPAEVPHVFDRFFQVENPNTKTGEGTGIGLAHSMELVKLMNGNITLESELGKGSVFTVILPIKREAGLRLANDDSRLDTSGEAALIPIETSNFSIENQSSAAYQNSETPTLLIIEDNADVVVYLKSCLTGRYQLDVAYNGKIGIEKAFEHIPDLIISDVMMPEKDGYEVCDILKNDERTSHIPIILLTAKADAASKIAGLRRGADAYLAKPFDKEELLVRLEKLLELRKRLQQRFTNANPVDAGSPPLEPPAEFIIEDAFLQKARAAVDKEIENPDFNPVRLSRALGMSQSQLYRKINALTGTAPAVFIRKIRLQRGMELLQTTDMNVSEIAYQVGFTDPAYFSRTFSEEFGSAPRENRK